MHGSTSDSLRGLLISIVVLIVAVVTFLGDCVVEGLGVELFLVFGLLVEYFDLLYVTVCLHLLVFHVKDLVHPVQVEVFPADLCQLLWELFLRYPVSKFAEDLVDKVIDDLVEHRCVVNHLVAVSAVIDLIWLVVEKRRPVHSLEHIGLHPVEYGRHVAQHEDAQPDVLVHAQDVAAHLRLDYALVNLGVFGVCPTTTENAEEKDGVYGHPLAVFIEAVLRIHLRRLLLLNTLQVGLHDRLSGVIGVVVKDLRASGLAPLPQHLIFRAEVGA